MRSSSTSLVFLGALLAALPASRGQAALILVPGEQPTIQAGIDAAESGDSVLVDPGHYLETLDFHGHSILVASRYLTTGDEQLIAQTVIDAGGAGTVVRFEAGEGFDATLTGFTVTGGDGLYGGGIACTQSSPTLSHLLVMGNQATGGAGIHCSDGASPRILATTIRDNSTTDTGTGGGLRCSGYASPVLRDVRIEDNSALHGGGLYCYWHPGRVRVGVTLEDNSANSTTPSSPSGGGVFVGGQSRPRLERVLIAGNTAGSPGLNLSGRGGGLFCSGSSAPVLVNVTLSANLATFAGGGLHCLGAAAPALVNAVLWGNAPQEIYFDGDFDPSSVTIAHSDVQGGEGGVVLNGNGTLDWRASNIDQAPLFAAGFALMPDSPCIDAGTAFFVLDGDTLADLTPADYSGTAPDMGAFEYQDLTGIEDDDDLASALLTPLNHPNPFATGTTLSYVLPRKSQVTLALYDVRGRLLRTLLRRPQAAGSHQLYVESGDLSAGIYLLELRTRDGQGLERRATRKLTLRR